MCDRWSGASGRGSPAPPGRRWRHCGETPNQIWELRVSTFLYRLGHLAVRRRGVVLAGWLILLATLGGLAAGLGKTADSSLTVPGVESVKANNLLSQRFPTGGESGAAARVVFAAPSGRTLSDPALERAVEDVLGQVR